MRRDALDSIVRPGDGPTYPAYSGWQRAGAWGSMLLGDHGVFRTFFNTRTPVSEELWRSSQPLPYQIASAARIGIKTIINLRGPSKRGYYRIEEQAAQRHGVTIINFVVYSREAPKATTVLAARDLFETIAYPALMHCKSGADRAGLMSALYLIFRKDMPVTEAKKQLSLRFGHVAQAKTGILDFFFQAYLDYDAKTPMPFAEWVESIYDPKALQAAFHAQWWASVLTDNILRRE